MINQPNKPQKNTANIATLIVPKANIYKLFSGTKSKSRYRVVL